MMKKLKNFKFLVWANCTLKFTANAWNVNTIAQECDYSQVGQFISIASGLLERSV